MEDAAYDETDLVGGYCGKVASPEDLLIRVEEEAAEERLLALHRSRKGEVEAVRRILADSPTIAKLATSAWEADRLRILEEAMREALSMRGGK